MKDVSDEYTGCTYCADLPFICQDTNKRIYLQSFGKEASSIVGIGHVHNNRLCFSHIGKDILYLPVFYDNAAVTPAGYPFRIDSLGHTHIFKPNKYQKISTTIYKMELSNTSLYRMQSGIFEGSNDADFSYKNTLFSIVDMPSTSFLSVRTIDITPYRYVRYVSPQGGFCNVAEIEFYGQRGQKLKGTPIGTKGSWYNSPMTCDKAFDGDIYTYYDAAEADYSWTGLDLGTVQGIDKIRFLPRIDDDRLIEGHTYEVHGWMDLDWKVMAKEKAVNNALRFLLPANGLFYLRDATNDTESCKFFIIENGQIRWI